MSRSWNFKPVASEDNGHTFQEMAYPKSIGFIVINEFCERFSYYGLRTILSLYLRDKLGYNDNGATVIYHVFSMFAYFFPVIGAMIADGWLGRYRTILYLSLVYAGGSVLIALTAVPTLSVPTISLTIVALLLIAFGTGGIKPCVSAFGGDQFKLPEQARYLATFFSLYYFAINAGSLISTFITPILRMDVHCFGDNDCYSLAFGVPGILMIISIIVFVAGKRSYVMKNPSGNIIGHVASVIGRGIVGSVKSKEKKDHWLDHATDKNNKALVEDVKILLRVLVLYLPLPIFWALFDQQGSRWTFQADRMEQRIGSWTLKADQMQVLNPLLILLFIPLFEVVIYPFMTWCKLIKKPLHKMMWGGFLAAFAFIISGIVELQLLPTYGTPVAAGLSQIRMYNGYPCDFILTGLNSNETITIPSLEIYEKLDIPTEYSIDLPYNIQGQGSSCLDYKYSGVFHLKEETANSFFIRRNEIFEFTDNNDKALNGANIRVLANVEQNVQVNIVNAKNDRIVQNFSTSSIDQVLLTRGTYNIIVDEQLVFNGTSFESGAVYTLNIYEDTAGIYSGKVVMITPPNTVHILWLVPQYIVITMAEVMFSITGLEFSFTQAPASMKSVVLSVWLLTVAFGNLIVILIVEGNFLDAQWKEFFLFAGLMAIDMLIFMVMAFRYKYVENKSSTSETREEIQMPETVIKSD